MKIVEGGITATASIITCPFKLKMQLENGHHYWGVANAGYCPTLTAGRQCRLEVHLFDFCANLYGQLLTIRFIKKLRDEKRFDSPEALHQQILCDLQTARLTFHFPA